MRLLLVEDNQADVFLVQDAMRHEGVNADIQVAADGERAIQLIESAEGITQGFYVDCFLIDFNLPRKGGADVLRAIRGSKVFCQSPVVMMTSSDAAAEHNKMLEQGATKVFVKPFLLSEFRALVKVVQAACENKTLATATPVKGM